MHIYELRIRDVQNIDEFSELKSCSVGFYSTIEKAIQDGERVVKALVKEFLDDLCNNDYYTQEEKEEIKEAIHKGKNYYPVRNDYDIFSQVVKSRSMKYVKGRAELFRPSFFF